MSITKRQFNLLQAMGIDVWQRRTLSPSPIIESSNNQTTVDSSEETSSTSTFESISLEQLAHLTIFQDIVRCLGITTAEVTVSDNKINLGIINWQISNSDTFTFEHNCLISPSLDKISNSTTLKRTLWKLIGHVSH